MKWLPQSQMIFEKNDMYWDKEAVQLDQIVCYMVSSATGLNLFQKGQLDWIGSPFSVLPLDEIWSQASLRPTAF